ncbi:branched-chain amino acid aminotransferase [Actinophytocola sp.]|uniref:branched-chain amino acid aminotransferase n=1 Tax=Actinophytocola sp. TaxID=1872138 RepID=UPI002ED4E0BC
MSTRFSVEEVEPTPAAERERRMTGAPFGEVFTDHMITTRWSAEEGWHDATLCAYGPLVLDPSAQVFHYGQEIFEGMKAYRTADGSVVLFRPYANAERFAASAYRMAMPEVPADLFVGALETLVAADRDWVPATDGHSLYLRPLMIATQPTLGFYQPSQSFLFVVIASPAGAYFSGGPVTVWLETEYTRAAPGGTGAAKCGGNYAGTLLAQQKAVKRGCDQVVWLDRGFVDEMGTSNLFFVLGDEVVTPPLNGTLLAGITRDSVLTLAADLGYGVAERPVSVEDWRAAAADGKLTEVFSSGTSSMITPVGRVRSEGGDFVIGDGTPGPVTTRLRNELSGLQTGRRPDPYGWVHKI